MSAVPIFCCVAFVIPKSIDPLVRRCAAIIGSADEYSRAVYDDGADSIGR